VLLSVWVLHARLLGGDEWAPYVEALPKTFDSPVHWDDDDGGGWGEAAGAAAAAEKVIEGTPLGEAVASKRRWLARLHAALPAALRESGLGELATVLIRPCTVLCHGPGCHPMVPASRPLTGGIIGSEGSLAQLPWGVLLGLTERASPAGTGAG
jgi:hypothetical protein